MPAHLNDADPRVRRTRQLLMTAFKELFQKKSFRDITVGDIADRATVNRGTFYDHFTDKFELLDQFMREELRAYLRGRQAVAQGWSGGNLRALTEAILDFAARVFHGCHPADHEMESIAQGVIVDEVAEIIRGWLREPAFPQRLSAPEAEAIATAWSWSIYGTALHWQRGHIGGTAAEVATRLTRLLLGAVASSTGGVAP